MERLAEHLTNSMPLKYKDEIVKRELLTFLKGCPPEMIAELRKEFKVSLETPKED